MQVSTWLLSRVKACVRSYEESRALKSGKIACAITVLCLAESEGASLLKLRDLQPEPFIVQAPHACMVAEPYGAQRATIQGTSRYTIIL